jgi:Cilia- and flagella-associated protein 54
VQDIQHGLNGATRHPQLHIAVYDATVQAHTICSCLITRRCSREALPVAVHAALAMGSSVTLRAPGFLSWRCALVATACSAYEDLGATTMARQLVGELRNDIQRLERMFALHPVPQRPEFLAQITEAQEYLDLLTFKFDAPGKAAADVLSSLKALRNGEKRATALLGALASPACCTAQLADLPAPLRGTFDALKSTLKPLMDTMQAALTDAAGRASRPHGDADQPASAAGVCLRLKDVKHTALFARLPSKYAARRCACASSNL